jgi:hypothetical protein
VLAAADPGKCICHPVGHGFSPSLGIFFEFNDIGSGHDLAPATSRVGYLGSGSVSSTPSLRALLTRGDTG